MDSFAGSDGCRVEVRPCISFIATYFTNGYMFCSALLSEKENSLAQR